MNRITRIIALALAAGMPAVSWAQTDSPLDNAVQLLETGHPDSAAVMLYRYVETPLGPDERVETLYHLSRSMRRLGRFGEEIQYLILARETSQTAPHSPLVDLEYASILLETGNFDECIGVTDSFRERYPDSLLMPDILYLAGTAYTSREDYYRAFNLLNGIIETYPDADIAAEAGMQAGLCLYHLDLIGGAIEHFEDYLVRSPEGRNAAEALYYLGRCYETTDNPDAAARAYRRLTIDFPANPRIIEVFSRLGTSFYNAGRLTDARNALLNYTANADSTEPAYDEALLALERIAYRLGEYPSEISVIEHFVTKYPANRLTPDMLFELARYYRVAGMYENALENYRILMTNPLYRARADSAAFLAADLRMDYDGIAEATEFLFAASNDIRSPVRRQLYLLRIAGLYEDSGHPQIAIGWYDSALTAASDAKGSVAALRGIGRAFTSMDRWLEASRTYERIIQDYPSYTGIKDVYLSLAEIYYLQGRLSEAASTAERAVRYAGGHEKNNIMLTVARYYEEIDRQHALRLYALITADSTSSTAQISTAWMHYGELAFRGGDRTAAAQAFAAVIDTGADSIQVRLARERLSMIGNPDRPDIINR